MAALEQEYLRLNLTLERGATMKVCGNSPRIPLEPSLSKDKRVSSDVLRLIAA